MRYLSRGPVGTLTNIGHTKAETFGATERIVVLKVIEPRFAQVTVSSHHIHLERESG